MNDLKGKVIVALIGTLVGIMATSIPVLASFPTKTEVRKLIEVESPYARDQRLILYRLGEIERLLKELVSQKKGG